MLTDQLKQYLTDTPVDELPISVNNVEVDFATSDLQQALCQFGTVIVSKLDTKLAQGITENSKKTAETKQKSNISANVEQHIDISKVGNTKQHISGTAYDAHILTSVEEDSSVKCLTLRDPTKVLLHPEEVGAIFGVAVCPRSGIIAATDNHAHVVKLFDSSGCFMREFGSFGFAYDQLDLPYGVDFTNEGNLLVSDGKNHRIKCYDLEGNVLFCRGRFGSSFCQFINPFGLCVDRQTKYVYVCDSGNHRVQRFYESGNPAPASWLNGLYFERPTQICVDKAGNVYVRDRSIVRYFSVSHGYTEQPLKLPKPAGIGSHKGITSSNDGKLCIAHSDNCVYVYDEHHRLIKNIICKGANTHNSYLTDIAISLDGRIIVAGKSFLEMY
jgi:WD40 repeat protein